MTATTMYVQLAEDDGSGALSSFRKFKKLFPEVRCIIWVEVCHIPRCIVVQNKNSSETCPHTAPHSNSWLNEALMVADCSSKPPDVLLVNKEARYVLALVFEPSKIQRWVIN